jgi:hypothetical protein
MPGRVISGCCLVIRYCLSTVIGSLSDSLVRLLRSPTRTHTHPVFVLGLQFSLALGGQSSFFSSGAPPPLIFGFSFAFGIMK